MVLSPAFFFGGEYSYQPDKPRIPIFSGPCKSPSFASVTPLLRPANNIASPPRRTAAGGVNKSPAFVTAKLPFWACKPKPCLGRIGLQHLACKQNRSPPAETAAGTQAKTLLLLGRNCYFGLQTSTCVRKDRPLAFGLQTSSPLPAETAAGGGENKSSAFVTAELPSWACKLLPYFP